jgi:hypothetical protein
MRSSLSALTKHGVTLNGKLRRKPSAFRLS